MKIAFFRVVTVLICMKRTVGVWGDFSYKNLGCVFFCLMLLLTLHGQVNFIDKVGRIFGKTRRESAADLNFQLVLKQASKPQSP